MYNHNPKDFKELIVFVLTLWLKQLFIGKYRFYHFPSFNDACCMVKFSWATPYQWPKKNKKKKNLSQIWTKMNGGWDN